MTIESLYPYDDVYQVIDEYGSVLHQGGLKDCLIIKELLNKK